MTLLTGGMVCLCLLQGWAQARAWHATISHVCRETIALHTSPVVTQDWKDLAVASHRYSECPQLSVNALHTGSVSSVMFGKVAKSQVLVFLWSRLHIRVRSLFTAFASHTLLLGTMLEAGVYQTQIGVRLFKNEMKYTRQMPNWMGLGSQLVFPG